MSAFPRLRPIFAVAQNFVMGHKLPRRSQHWPNPLYVRIRRQGAADALFDLAKALFCCAHEDPRSREPVLAGYGEINHPAPGEALWLYTLFHRVVMWCHLTRPGDTSDGAAGLLHDLYEMSR